MNPISDFRLNPKSKTASPRQRILVFQQNGSGESKIAGILKYAQDAMILERLSIDQAVPEVIDNTADYLAEDFVADLVLDYLTHPDLSHDLALICKRKKIPVIASGKKAQVRGVITPPT